MDLIEKLAREHGTGGWQTLDDMVRFGKAVAAAEREACAKLVEAGKIVPTLHEGTVAVDWDSSEEAAAAIRAL